MTIIPFKEYRYFGGDSRREIDESLAKAKALLGPCGYSVNVNRFPFAMHHAAYRNKLPRVDKRLLTHSQIAGLLNTWAMERKSPHDYVWQAVYGAVLSSPMIDIISIPETVREKFEMIEYGAQFEKWATDRIKHAHHHHRTDESITTD